MSKRGAEDVLESPRLQGPIQSTTENTSNAFAGKTADELKDLYAQISNNAAVPMAEKEDFIQVSDSMSLCRFLSIDIRKELMPGLLEAAEIPRVPTNYSAQCSSSI